jgi:heme exporter protein D
VAPEDEPANEDFELTAHALYVLAAYAASAVALAGLVAWILLDYRARRRELAELEAEGIRRRSARQEVQP